MARAVSSLAHKLLAGSCSLSREADLSSRAGWLARAAQARGRHGAAAKRAGSQGEQQPVDPPRERRRPRQQRSPGSPAQPHPVVHSAVPKQGQQAQQLLAELMQHLGEAALRREQADRAEEEEARRRQQACERAWMKKAKRRAQQQAQTAQQQQQAEQACLSSAPRHQQRAQQACHALSLGCAPAWAASGTGLDSLREAAWQAAHDQEVVAQALLAAWRQGCSLLGSPLHSPSPTPLGAAPAVWALSETGPCAAPLPAGVVLLRVHQLAPLAGTSFDSCQLDRPSLRLLVYSRQDGVLLHAQDGVAVADAPLAPHPRFGLPCWDSG
ncbi:hypothetical protein ABPG75_003393 [Micractinium tetrahymenae]